MLRACTVSGGASVTGALVPGDRIRLVFFAVLVGVLGGLLVAWPARAQEGNPRYVLAIHSGAGTLARSDRSPDREAAYHAALREALEAGYQVLKEGAV